jgi:hypothetical protein
MDISKLTQEELNKILSDKDAAEKLAKEQNKKIKEIEDNSGLLAELKQQKEQAELALYKKTLTERKQQLSKWLQTKKIDDALLDKIGKMDESEFDFFKDGKTDDVYISKEEIDTKKQELESKTTELEKNKEKIRKELQEELVTKEDKKDKIVPPTEINSEGDEGEESGDVLPSIAEVKKLYNLEGKPFYKLKEGHEKKAERYLQTQDYENYLGG